MPAANWIVLSRNLSTSLIVLARYLELAAKDTSIRTIDATQPLEAVMADIRHTITQWVKEQRAHEMVPMVTTGKLVASYQTGRGHHALLIQALPGMGDDALIYALSRYLMCQQPEGIKAVDSAAAVS